MDQAKETKRHPPRQLGRVAHRRERRSRRGKGQAERRHLEGVGLLALPVAAHDREAKDERLWRRFKQAFHEFCPENSYKHAANSTRCMVSRSIRMDHVHVECSVRHPTAAPGLEGDVTLVEHSGRCQVHQHLSWLADRNQSVVYTELTIRDTQPTGQDPCTLIFFP